MPQWSRKCRTDFRQIIRKVTVVAPSVVQLIESRAAHLIVDGDAIRMDDDAVDADVGAGGRWRLRPGDADLERVGAWRQRGARVQQDVPLARAREEVHVDFRTPSIEIAPIPLSLLVIP